MASHKGAKAQRIHERTLAISFPTDFLLSSPIAFLSSLPFLCVFALCVRLPFSFLYPCFIRGRLLFLSTTRLGYCLRRRAVPLNWQIPCSAAMQGRLRNPCRLSPMSNSDVLLEAQKIGRRPAGPTSGCWPTSHWRFRPGPRFRFPGPRAPARRCCCAPWRCSIRWTERPRLLEGPARSGTTPCPPFAARSSTCISGPPCWKKPSRRPCAGLSPCASIAAGSSTASRIVDLLGQLGRDESFLDETRRRSFRRRDPNYRPAARLAVGPDRAAAGRAHRRAWIRHTATAVEELLGRWVGRGGSCRAARWSGSATTPRRQAAQRDHAGKRKDSFSQPAGWEPRMMYACQYISNSAYYQLAIAASLIFISGADLARLRLGLERRLGAWPPFAPLCNCCWSAKCSIGSLRQAGMVHRARLDGGHDLDCRRGGRRPHRTSLSRHLAG